ncbi:MAG: ligand-gated channel protein, partial [Candidatus Accumulibacter sp.]|nr:ligand-gated channel protein [Accumulibacter sp.]
GFARMTGGAGALGWLAGIEAQFGTIDARRYLNIRRRKGALTARTDQRAHTLNAYGELRYSPAPTLTLIAGGQAVQGRRAVRDRIVPERSDAASFTEVSPKVGLLWQATPAIQLFANISRAGELPTFSELVQTGYTDFVPLDAQRSWTFEAGTRGSAGPLRWDVALYRSALRGELLSYVNDPALPALTLNADRTRHQGIEAALDWTLRPGVTLRTAYTLNDFRFVGDRSYSDNRLPVVPVHRLFAELDLRMGAVGLRPSLDWLPRGAWADYENSARAPGYVLAGLGGTLALSPRATLFLDARNLGNRRGIADIAAVKRAAAASAIYYPLEGRSFYGGVRIEL